MAIEKSSARKRDDEKIRRKHARREQNCDDSAREQDQESDKGQTRG